MTMLDPKFQQAWDDAHQQLKTSMQKEITTMREILANLYEEELSLQLNDQAKMHQVLLDRSSMISRLSSVRSVRMQATQTIEKLALPKEGGRSATLEELLPLEEPDSCEILILRDQLLALVDRVNQQNIRNQVLQYQIENHPHSHIFSPLPQKSPASSPNGKRKTYLETID